MKGFFLGGGIQLFFEHFRGVQISFEIFFGV